MEPIYPEPYYISTVWAGERLSGIRRLPPAPSGKIGIAREVCAYKGAENKVGQGSFAGRSVRELIEGYHTQLMGDDPSDQLIRVAYIDAAEDLSIQVHPGEEYAKRVEHDFEKSEAWYVLDCGPGAYVIAGATTTDRRVLKQAAMSGGLEQYVCRIPVQKGDVVMIPAGMLHACGRDMLAVEIGSFGGITYRLYDYGRNRPLDIEKSFEVLDPSLRCELKHFPPVEGNLLRNAVSHSLFHLNILDVTDTYVVRKPNRYEILTSVEGQVEIVIGEMVYPLSYTHSILIPACISGYTLKGSGRLIQSFRPQAEGVPQ